MRSFAVAALLLWVWLPSVPGIVVADEQPAAKPPASDKHLTKQFVRFVDDGKGGGKLEAAIVTYRNRQSVTVHLVAALHVGEKEYYQGLSKTFKTYDALLYEMVKPKDTPPPQPGQRSQSAVSAFQRFLKDTLQLDFQLDDIDYTAPNFVHADLDYETFSRLQTERGESILGIMLQSMLRQMSKEMAGEGDAKAQQFGLFDLLVALKAPDRARQLKLLLAHEFDDIEDEMAGLTGPNGSVIITERNKAALAKLQEVTADGKKNVGIFFGAGHMGDMEERLLAMGFRRTRVEWRVGWDMTAKPGDPTTRPATHPALPDFPMP